MNRRWLISKTNPEYVKYLSKTASVSPVLAQILINRGVKTPGDVHDFLYSGMTNLSDPFELPGMGTAVERIKRAFDRNERVFVHGDYDTDGLTATAIMVHAMKAMDMDVHYFIPDRKAHGYGFNPPSVDIAKRLGVKLIVTVDCGITAFDAAASAKESGIDLIITDHHEPIQRDTLCVTRDELKDPEAVTCDSSLLTCLPAGRARYLLPEALAVINPKLTGHDSRITNLSGAGIAFKVVQALAMDHTMPLSADDALSLLDLAALGTIADVAPLVGENRIICGEGLKYIQSAYRPGIKSLLEVSGLCGKEARAGLLSFTVVPRINASGRMGDAGEVVGLFLSDSPEETLSVAEKLDRTNAERQKIEEEVYSEALSQLNGKGYDAVIVLHGKGWHMGVIGIVASRIAEEFFRPTLVFTIEDGVAKGSARSIPTFDVHAGLSSCSDVLISFGGHKQAAGVKLHESRLPLFEEKINKIVRDSLVKDDFIRTVRIDAEVVLPEVTFGLIKELSLLEPFGSGNPQPLLGARGLDILNARIVGKNHLKMTLRQDQGRQRSSPSLDAIGFDMGKLLEDLGASQPVDAAFIPTINEWNGRRSLQLTLKGLRPGR